MTASLRRRTDRHALNGLVAGHAQGADMGVAGSNALRAHLPPNRKAEGMKLHIVIPTYNSPDVLANCIASLFTNTDIKQFEHHLTIINNGEVIPPLLVSGSDVRLHHMHRNLGWMGGVNYGLDRDPGSDFFVMMNDDLLFVPGSDKFWRNLTDVSSRQEVGAVAPSSNYVSGYQNAFWHTPWKRVNCGYLIGMLMMVDTSLIQQEGGLDEGLPGGDDLDFSIRIRKAGYGLVAVRDSYVHHIGSQTGRREQPKFWDSHEHQSKTYNAIMKKHGVKAYWDMLNWTPTEASND